MVEYIVTATFNVRAATLEDAVERVTQMLDEGRAVSPETAWSVFEPDGEGGLTEYEIEWNEDELRDPDDDSPSGTDHSVEEYDGDGSDFVRTGRVGGGGCHC